MLLLPSLLVCVVKLFIWYVAVCCLCVCVPDVLVCGRFGCETTLGLRFEFLAAVNIKKNVYFLPSSTLMIQAENSAERFVSFHGTTRHGNRQDGVCRILGASKRQQNTDCCQYPK